MDSLYLLYALLACVVLSFWRIAWIGLVVPAWRLSWKTAVALAVLIWVGWRVEGEAESGAYHS